MIIPRVTFLAVIQEACLTYLGQVFAWESWGPHGASLVHLDHDRTKPLHFLLPCCSVQGTVVLRHDRGPTENCLRIRVLDYGYLGVAKYLNDVSLGKAGSATQVHTDSRYRNSKVFLEDDISTTLPARVIETDLNFENGRTFSMFDSLKVGEDCLIMEFTVSVSNESHLLQLNMPQTETSSHVGNERHILSF